MPKYVDALLNGEIDILDMKQTYRFIDVPLLNKEMDAEKRIREYVRLTSSHFIDTDMYFADHHLNYIEMPVHEIIMLIHDDEIFNGESHLVEKDVAYAKMKHLKILWLNANYDKCDQMGSLIKRIIAVMKMDETFPFCLVFYDTLCLDYNDEESIVETLNDTLDVYEKGLDVVNMGDTLSKTEERIKSWADNSIILDDGKTLVTFVIP